MEQDFVMIILNCKKYKNKALFQKVTWLPKVDSFLKYYHVIGDESIDQDYIFHHESNLLIVKTKDDYNSLPEKVFMAQRAISETFKFKYLFKTDDDQILVEPRFLNMISRVLMAKTPHVHYAGYIVDVPKPYLCEYHRIHPELPKHLPVYQTKYCSGRFYVLSNEAVQDLQGKKERITSEYLEDYANGFHLNDRFKETMFNIETNKYFTDIELSDFPTWEAKLQKDSIK